MMKIVKIAFGAVLLVIGLATLLIGLAFTEWSYLPLLFGVAIACFGLFIILPAPPKEVPSPAARAQGRTDGIRYNREVAGESQYQAALERIAGPRGEDGCNLECTALLKPEPQNPHDPNAVGVWIDRRKVGYLPRSDATAWNARLANEGDASKSVEVPAKIVGGWYVDSDDQGQFGVKLSY